MPAGHPDYDAIFSTTLKNYRPKLVDNVFGDRPLVSFLKRKDKIRLEDGGAKIVVPLLYAQNSTAKSYSGYDTLDITPQEGISAAEYEWKQFAASIAISGIEEAKNRGKHAVVNLLKAKIMQAEMTIVDVMDEMFFGDGTTSGRDWNGLDLLVNDENATVTTVGGIDASDPDNAWWRSVVVDAADLGSTERDDAVWTNAYNTASSGNDKPDFAITTQELFEHYEDSLAPQLRFTSNNEADGRFQNLAFKGLTLYYDDYTPAGNTFFLNSKYIELVGHRDRWFRSTGFKEAIDKDARWAQILSYGNMVVSNRARQARVIGQTVA